MLEFMHVHIVARVYDITLPPRPFDLKVMILLHTSATYMQNKPLTYPRV